MKRLIRSDGFWFVISTLVVLLAAIWLSFKFWDWLDGGADSGSETIRDIGVVVGGVLAVLLALWRSRVAERQANAAQRQSETAQRGLLNERYQKGAEMLGSDVLAVRLGGIYALARLASEHPEDYHLQILSLLCAFVRHPVAGEAAEPTNGGSLTMVPTYKTGGNKIRFERPLRAREDIQAVMTAVHERSEPQIRIEEEEEYRLNLSGANLAGVYLVNTNLMGADLTGANLTGADLAIVNLNGAHLEGVNLTGANLTVANLTDADLEGANLAVAYLAKCTGLTQGKLDLAAASTDTPPRLHNVVDAHTGEPLVWRGRSITE